MKQVLLTAWICLVVAFVAYKIGDSRGFQAGYEAGYVYDCKDEIRSLRDAHEDLKKAVGFAQKKATEVQMENARLVYSRDHLQDSLRNVERVHRLNDSIDALIRSGKLRVRPVVDPYTGKVSNGPENLLRAGGFIN